MSNTHLSSMGGTHMENESYGIYGDVTKLSDHYSDKFGIPKKKALSFAYEVLLKKSNTSYKGLPKEWDDEDVQNATLLEIHKRCSIKKNWTKELCSKVLNYFDVLYKNKDSDHYQNSIGPVLKMLLCIEYNQKKIPKKEKDVDKVFDTEIISAYFDKKQNYRTKEEVKFFSLPNFHGLSQNLSVGNIFFFKSNQESMFDFVFRTDSVKKVRSSYELDEGFVTPNDDHVERTPCFEIVQSSLPPPKIDKPFEWDYKVVSIPPIRHDYFETYDLIGNVTVIPPFIHKDILLQQWLCKAPEGVTKISKEQLIHDIMALLIGVPSSTFILQKDNFKMKDNIYTNELTPNALVESCQDFMEAGAAFKVLTNLSETKLDDVITSAFKISLREYLSKYQLIISQAYDKYNEESYLKFITSMKPLVEQVILLKKILVHDVPLKGVSLLKHLFDLIGCAPSSSIFYILSSLFLLPCVYYFRLIDDWVFLGKWNKDLPLTPYSMELVNDRKSWLEAHRPINTEIPWFLSVQDLAHCGKAISLLSLSKRNEKFLNLLKSNKRPKVKLCLDLVELDKFKKECEIYYEEVTSSFYTNIEEEVDLVQCAINAAQIKTAAFESSRLEVKMKEIKKKKDELCLREEDLIRSAQNKALQKQEEEAENERVMKECEEIMLKEQKKVLEGAKAVYARFKHILENEEKQNEYYSYPPPNVQPMLLKVKESSLGGAVCKDFNETMLGGEPQESVCKLVENLKQSTGFIRNDQNQVSLMGDVKDNMNNDVVYRTENGNIPDSLIQDNIFLDENLNADVIKEQQQGEENVKEAKENVNIEMDSVIRSDINENLKSVETENSKLEMCGTVQIPNAQRRIEMTENKLVKNIIIEDKMSDLERNRMKVLGSDLGRGENIRIHIWCEETERNKRNMLESHLNLDYGFQGNQKNIDGIESFSKKAGSSNLQEDVTDSEFVNVNDISLASEKSDINVSKESEKLAFDNQDTERTSNKEDHIMDSSDNSSEDQLFKLKWYEDPKSNEMWQILKRKNPVLISDKDIDFALLNKLLDHSLKIVLNIQVKLVNNALLTMFLKEFGLLKVAQKLSEYFFLHGEFGKRLTASLSKAVEEENPATLLTFCRLRSIFVDACGGDIKEISFIVKETPDVFQHNSSQVLSCLSLTYKFEWPLNLIFTDIAISKYNDVFEYMLALHRVAWHLEEVSLSLNFKPILLRGHQYTQIQLYRHVMSQFVSTLRSYIVTTVIESCWRDFIKDASKAKDLDELYRRHAVYIKDIKSKCFLDEKSGRLMEQIQKLLEDVLIFCRVLRFGEWNVSVNEEYRHSNFKKLRSTFSSFLKLARTVTKCTEKLFKIDHQKEHESLYYFLTLNSFYIS